MTPGSVTVVTLPPTAQPLNSMNTENSQSPFGEVVYSYTRAQAVADGFQVEVSKTAQEAGIRFPAFLTRTVYDAYVTVPPDVTGQDEAGRLWDIVWMLRFAICKAQSGQARLPIALYVRNDTSGTNWFTLYTLTPTRADSLAAGALLALLMRLPKGEHFTRKLYHYAGAIAGLLLVAASAGGFDPIHHPLLRDLFYSALAIFFSALLFWSIDPIALRGIPKRFYENRILMATGGYSYCIYIVHLPVMYLIKNLAAQRGFYNPKQESWTVAATLITLSVALTVGVAFISFHLYEKQFLKLKRFFPERSTN